MTGPEPVSYATQSVHIGAEWDVRCYVYPDRVPILAITAGRAHADITLTGRHQVSAGSAGFARELAKAAGQFAAECERLHAAQQNNNQAGDGSQPGAGTTAAA